MHTKKEFKLAWLRNIALGCSVVLVLAYIFLIELTVFERWRDKLAALLLTTIIYSLTHDVLLPNIFRWSRYNAYLLIVWMICMFALFVGMLALLSRCMGVFVFQQGEWDLANFWPVAFLILPATTVAFFMHSWNFAVRKWLAYRATQLKCDAMTSAATEWELDAIARNLAPHFITNSISTIRTLIRKDPEQALLAVGILGRITTYYLKMDKGPWISLRLEMAMTYKLVHLYQFIKQHEICVQFENDAGADGFIPKMLLFNLVENALHYGETHMQEYPIHIRITRGKDHLVKLRVSNRMAGKAMDGKVSHHTALNRIERQLLLLDPQHACVTVHDDTTVFTVSVSFSSTSWTDLH